MLLKRKAGARRKRRQKQKYECHCCRKEYGFCWRCRCGLHMCQDCMHDNLWGLTCNNITWNCPDCERSNGFGNQ